MSLTDSLRWERDDAERRARHWKTEHAKAMEGLRLSEESLVAERAARKEAERRAEENREATAKWMDVAEDRGRRLNEATVALAEAERQRDEARAESGTSDRDAERFRGCWEAAERDLKRTQARAKASEAEVAALREALRRVAVDHFGTNECGCRLCGASWHTWEDEAHVPGCPCIDPAPTSAPEEPTR